MTQPNARLQATVSGLVQGVNFRYATYQQAQELKLTGWVRNRIDGRVELVAEGPRPSLEQLLDFLHRGPPMAQVGAVQADWGDPSGEFGRFEIRH